MYGKLHHETFDFGTGVHKFFEEYMDKYPAKTLEAHNALIGVRNKVVALFKSWVGSKKLEQKFGVEIPLSAEPPSLESFLEKQGRVFRKEYRKCEICGDDRITHFCHIIPREMGGADRPSNYFYLCANHHHLFDHNRLYKEEWEKLNWEDKSQASQEYLENVKLPLMREFWQKSKIKNNHKNRETL